MALSRGKLAKAFAPGLASIYFARIDAVKREYAEWINIRKSTRAWEEDWKLTGLGPFVKKNEGGVYTFDEPIPGDTIRYTHQTFGLALRIYLEFIEDEQYGLMNRMTSELGKAAALNKETRAASVLNNAIDTAFTGFDGLPLLHVAHPLLGGGTISNRLSPDADLDLAPLQAAIQALDTMTDDRGVIEPITAAYLVVGPLNYIKAIELLETQQTPYTANNTVNVIATKYGIKVIVNHYLTDPDAWFLLARKGEHDLNMFIRKDDSFKSADDPLTDDHIHTGRHRLSEGFGNFRGVFGSVGV